MHLPSCVLLSTFLSTGVTAFYPYSFKLDISSGSSSPGKLKSRFFPWTLPANADKHGISLDIKKVPNNVRQLETLPNFDTPADVFAGDPSR